MRYIFMCLVVMLYGCSAMNMATEKAYNALPSAKNCTDVSYIRKNRDITIEAKCVAPVESASVTNIPGL
jgi:hypothetical protein